MGYNVNATFIIIGVLILFILMEVLMFNAFRKRKEKLNTSKYGLGYVICVGSSLVVLVIAVLFPIYWVAFFCIIFVPLTFNSFMLTKKVLQSARFKNKYINFTYKLITIFLIWFIAFFPLSFFAIEWVLETPDRYAEKQEIKRQKEQILEYETYVDLTEFGLGEYKLGNKGDEYLWDITRKENRIYEYDGLYMIFETSNNLVNDECWDDWNEHKYVGKDETYDVAFYDETYIIIPPMWDETGAWYNRNVVFLCKDINKDADLFEIEISESENAEKLLEQPREQHSRKELSEKLGKTF